MVCDLQSIRLPLWIKEYQIKLLDKFNSINQVKGFSVKEVLFMVQKVGQQRVGSFSAVVTHC